MLRTLRSADHRGMENNNKEANRPASRFGRMVKLVVLAIVISFVLIVAMSVVDFMVNGLDWSNFR